MVHISSVSTEILSLICLILARISLTESLTLFNLSKLNYFMGKYFQENDECLTYYKEGIENAKKCDENVYLSHFAT